LIEAMESLPQHTLIIGSKLLCDTKLPSNVKAQQFVREEYIRLMRAAQIVIVPIRQGLIRSTGHQTYLNAMLLKKPTIVNHILGVQEYTKNGQSAIIVAGTPESYIEAIKKASNPENKAEIEQMCELGRELAAGQYTFENHANRLLEIIDEAITDYYQYSPQGVSHFPTIGLRS
jgi:glycosyltransferase involved in cell wall biosynthesis